MSELNQFKYQDKQSECMFN